MRCRLYPTLYPMGYRALPYPHALPRFGAGLADIGANSDGPRNIVLFVSRGSRVYAALLSSALHLRACAPESS